MKFNIFWVDDSKVWVKSVHDDLVEKFSDLDFVPEIMCFEEVTRAREAILNTYADLILVDCNLPDNVRGDDFIRELRKNRCFAHVIFYSQDADNLGALDEDKHFIHVTHRDAISDVFETVADQAYRKYKHPAFMRGLLLSEFIDLENLIEDLISQCFKTEEEYFRKNIIHKGGESFSLATKQKFVARLMKEALLKKPDLAEAFKKIPFSTTQFDKHIISKRNILAHAHPKYDPRTGQITLISAIDNVDFNGDWFHETREKIHVHKTMVKALLDINLYQVVNP